MADLGKSKHSHQSPHRPNTARHHKRRTIAQGWWLAGGCQTQLLIVSLSCLGQTRCKACRFGGSEFWRCKSTLVGQKLGAVWRLPSRFLWCQALGFVGVGDCVLAQQLGGYCPNPYPTQTTAHQGDPQRHQCRYRHVAQWYNTSAHRVCQVFVHRRYKYRPVWQASRFVKIL